MVKVFFAPAGESYDELADNGIDPLPSFGWNAFEKQQVMEALEEYTKIIGINYVETTNEAEAEFRLITTTSEQLWRLFLSAGSGLRRRPGHRRVQRRQRRLEFRRSSRAWCRAASPSR